MSATRSAILAFSLILSQAVLAQGAGGGAPGGAPGAGAVTAPTRVAIVNPTRILTEIQEWKDTYAKFQQEKANIKDAISKRQLEVRDKKAELDALKPDSPGYEDKRKQLMGTYIESDTWQKTTTADFDGRYKLALKNLFDKVTTAVAQVATKRGVDLVITDIRPQINDEGFAQLNPDQLIEVLSRRNVLFATAAVELTNEVITEMDARYKSGQ